MKKYKNKGDKKDMKYNTIIKEIEKENAIELLKTYEKNIISLLGIQAKINVKENFKFYSIKNGFTINQIESILKIDLNNYNIAWFTQYNYKNNYDTEIKTAFKTSLYTWGLENNHKKRIDMNISQYYRINNNDSEFEKKRKNQFYSNESNIIFYLLIQEKKTQKEKYKINYTWDRLKILYRGYTYTTFETYNNIKVLDTTLYDIQLDKSGYYNAHIKELREKALKLHAENQKEKILNYKDFEIDFEQIKTHKQKILKEFYNISLQCKNKFDFDFLGDISSDISYFLNNIESLQKDINNKKFVSVESYKKALNHILSFKINKNKTFYKECFIHDLIEKEIEKEIKEKTNNKYFSVSVSFSDKNLKKENNIITYKNTIENIHFNIIYNLDDIKIYSWEV